MVLKLRRREETFIAYQVVSGDFNIGSINIQEHTLSKSWVWTIGNVNVHADGRGPAHGSGSNLEDAMAQLARRWRLWLSLAGLGEIGPGVMPPDSPPLTLVARERGPSEGYVVATNGITLGVVGRTFGMDNSRWYWSFSAVYDPERGGSKFGGGATSDEALTGFMDAWQAWLALAALGGSEQQSG